MLILLIEDDDQIAERLSKGFAEAGFAVERAATGDDGFVLGVDTKFDAAVLDLGLPGMVGLDVLKQWRKQSVSAPVLVLTARSSWAEKILVLNAGADDYVTKPFHMDEVIARLRALIRRSSGLTSSVLQHGSIQLDLAASRVTQNGVEISLSPHELKMLNYFMHRIGRIVSQSELVDHLYSINETRESNTVEVYVSRLRRKLGSGTLTTVRGLGYRMD